MNNIGAISGMIVGITFTAGYIIFFKFIRPELNVPAHWLFGISPEGIGNAWHASQLLSVNSRLFTYGTTAV